MENTSELQEPQSPCIPWPRPGVDAIQLVTWSQYLRLWATELDRLAGGGEPGLFLANYLTSLALQAEVLGATSAADHSTKAAIEAEREAAWQAALEAEAAQSGSWELGSGDPDDPEATGSLDGHPGGANQYWIGADPDDITYRN